MEKILGEHVLAKYLKEHLKISTVFGHCECTLGKSF